MTEIVDNQTKFFRIQGPLTGMGAVCEPVLRALAGWFGVERAILQYCQDVEQLPTWVAWVEDAVPGFVTIKRHKAYAAEILVIGIRTEYHRMGIGRALVLAGEQFLKAQSVLLLQVKALSSLRPDDSYARSRGFILAWASVRWRN